MQQDAQLPAAEVLSLAGVLMHAPGTVVTRHHTYKLECGVCFQTGTK